MPVGLVGVGTGKEARENVAVLADLPKPLALMAVDALLMAISTFVGSATGSTSWLHLVVLCVWSLLCGLLVSAGNRGGVLGVQAIIAVCRHGG